MLSYCLKCRENTESKDPEVARLKTEEYNDFIKVCSV